MKVTPAGIHGAGLIQSCVHRDERGSFARLSCRKVLEEAGLPGDFVQSSLSITNDKHVLRGMHFQLPPSAEDKLVQCLRGHIYDVIIDVRPDSPTYLQHVGVDLRGGEGLALFVPSGCAHGFMTLEPDCYVFYQMTDFYQPELGRGVRWNDPAFAVRWPVTEPDGHERDLSYPDFDPELVKAFEGRS